MLKYLVLKTFPLDKDLANKSFVYVLSIYIKIAQKHFWQNAMKNGLKETYTKAKLLSKCNNF